MKNEVWVKVGIERYDELVKKEKYLEILLAGLSKLSGYENVTSFKEHMGITEPVKEDEEVQ